MVELKDSLFRRLEVKDQRASHDSDFRKGAAGWPAGGHLDAPVV